MCLRRSVVFYSGAMTDREEHAAGPRFNPRGRKLVYVQIADVITARIEEGTYPPEGRLPAELELTAEFGAARVTIRQAIGELRRRGLVETTHGKGTFVVPPEERTPPG